VLSLRDLRLPALWITVLRDPLVLTRHAEVGMCAVLPSDAGFDVVISINEIDEVRRIVCWRVIVAVAPAASVNQCGPVVELGLSVAKQIH
jgi:hypothetical protein